MTNILINQNSRINNVPIRGVAEAGDIFGASVVAGNFDGRQGTDLAVGVPGEDIGAISNAGAVNVLRGSSSGLTANGDQVWHQNSSGILGVSEAGDRFGASLNVGDFNLDGFDDLAIGVFGEDIDLIGNAGSAQIIFGSITGLAA